MAEAVYGSILLLGGRAVSTVQTALFLEPAGEKLAPELRSKLQRVFGDSIDFDAVRIKRGFSGVFSANDRPFVHGNTAYMKDDWDMHSIVHEMTHVWQHQNGGPIYMGKALAAQQFGDAYDWKKGLAEGKSFAQLDPEQQAEMIADAYKAGFFNTTEDEGNARFVVLGVDYTRQLREALRNIRAGEGTP